MTDTDYESKSEGTPDGYHWAMLVRDGEWEIVEIEEGRAYGTGCRDPWDISMFHQWGPYLGTAPNMESQSVGQDPIAWVEVMPDGSREFWDTREVAEASRRDGLARGLDSCVRPVYAGATATESKSVVPEVMPDEVAAIVDHAGGPEMHASASAIINDRHPVSDTECKSHADGDFVAWLDRMADAERSKAVDRTASRQSDMAFGRMQAFEDAASRLRWLSSDTECRSVAEPPTKPRGEIEGIADHLLTDVAYTRRHGGRHVSMALDEAEALARAVLADMDCGSVAGKGNS